MTVADLNTKYGEAMIRAIRISDENGNSYWLVVVQNGRSPVEPEQVG